MTTEDRIKFHLLGEFKGRRLSTINRDELQTFLDVKAAKLSFSTVDHSEVGSYGYFQNGRG